MKKKKLDELFQEKFLDFKEMPENKVWRSIEASLDKKEKKRKVPIWWTFGGIAAAFLITFLLINPFDKIKNVDENIVNSKEGNIHNELKTDSLQNKQITNTKKVQETLVESNSTSNLPKNNIEQKEEHYNANNKPSLNNSTKNTILGNPYKIIAQTKSSEKEIENTGNSIKNSQNILENNTLINENAIVNSQNLAEKENTSRGDSLNLNVSTAVTSNRSKSNPEATKKLNKKSIFDEISNQEEEIKENSVASSKWSAGPSIAPVYFNALGEGSSVHSIFVPNSKSGNVNLSFGVSVAYQVSKKLSIRSGLHKVDYGYDTNDISFSSSLSAISGEGQINTIDYSATSKTIVVASKRVASEQFNTTNSAIDVSAKSASRDGFMSQQLGYLEIPLEINYSILNTRFGIDLVSGFSSLLLVNNDVSLTSGSLTTEMGEANNVNNLNFSANMGLGLHYKFNPKIRFNFEPIFKYQLNTFSEVDGNFNPYSVGVYSGITFKF